MISDMLVFVDVEFNKGRFTSIGAVYEKNTFFQRIDKFNKNHRDILVKFYNFLPDESMEFVFFGKEDMKILGNIDGELPDNIASMVEHMQNGIDITEYLKPLRFSLYDYVNNLRGNLATPLHDPLNDAINLQTLYNKLHEKKAISYLLKLYKSTGTNLGNLDKELYEKLKTLDMRCAKPQYNKGSTAKVLHKIVLINKENGEQFILNDISSEDLTESNIYSIKTPRILEKYKGNTRECVIWILENVDGKTLSLELSLKKMSNETGNSLEFCDKVVQNLLEKCDLLRLSSIVYQINEDIKLLDDRDKRRLLFGKNRIKVIY